MGIIDNCKWKSTSVLGILVLTGVSIFYTYEHLLNWVEIVPSVDVQKNDEFQSTLKWQECSIDVPRGYDCATLQTPLDWNNTEDQRSASIAVLRWKAGGGNTPREEVLGSVIFNPGGPGGSGFDMLLGKAGNDANHTTGEDYDNILNHKFDVVSFDPRGVGHTIPRVQCYNDEFTSLVYRVNQYDSGLPELHGRHSHTLDYTSMLAQTELLAEVCASADGAEDVLPYVGTVSVAHDLAVLHEALGDEKINYWGYSYGTVLGSTFADIFPERVGRMVLDGCVDAPNHYAGLWDNNYLSSDRVWAGFFEECIAGGKDACPLAKLTQNADDLQSEVETWIDSLRSRPIAVPLANPPQVLTYSALIQHLFQTLYKPARAWPPLAANLYSAMIENNATKLCQAATPDYNAFNKTVGFYENLAAIFSADTLAPPHAEDWDVEKYAQHLETCRAESPRFGGIYGALAPLSRSKWKYRNVLAFEGHFSSKTAYPILTIGNDFDPITPGRFAGLMASRFPGAVSVNRGGYGHCSSSQPSSKLYDLVRDYFVHGWVPPNGTRCEPDVRIFEPLEMSSPAHRIALSLYSQSTAE